MPDEDAMIDHGGAALAEHFRAYLTTPELVGTSPVHRDNVRFCLERGREKNRQGSTLPLRADLAACAKSG